MHNHTILKKVLKKGKTSESKFINEVIQDLWVCLVSREVSLLGRKEVLTGKAKFGILGDGKEVPQVVMAKYFEKGDFRTGYYRDQTFMFSKGLCSIEDFFAQLYADSKNDPFSKGRQMNSHFATPFIDENDEYLNLTKSYNVTSDISCTAGQMGRALGVALASKHFREIPKLKKLKHLSKSGNELSFCTIGDASTSEGAFWETMNAAAVMQVPLVVCVWDDGYGISVPIELQTVKGSISRALEGFLESEDHKGIMIYAVEGHNYPDLCNVFEKATARSRETHQPCVIHVKELTQPQGHSTSGSHERYKDKERLEWESQFDCIEKMIEWVISIGIMSEDEINEMRMEAKALAKDGKNRSWKNFTEQFDSYKTRLLSILTTAKAQNPSNEIAEILSEVNRSKVMVLHEVMKQARRLNFYSELLSQDLKRDLNMLMYDIEGLADDYYHSDLYSRTSKGAINIESVPAIYSENSEVVNGYQVLNKYFDHVLNTVPEFCAFGEDVGQIGDVNQGFAGLQLKYGDSRVFDSGIREWTIIGQGIGLALRGLRPIAEIQYLDYINYAYSPISDDLATIRYRSAGLQAAPLIIRTRGHRLEGIWHAGSQLGTLIHAFRGIYVCVPRNMVQAVGMYNTLMAGSDPALVIECLNGYRLKEALPDNLTEFKVKLGVPEILQEGTDMTLVSYGSCIRVVEEALELIQIWDISVELIDAQTLLPFDTEGIIGESLRKTNRLLIVDEDVPGGASAYMLNQILENQDGYYNLDAKPKTLTAKSHRPPYGSDGDYFSKPNAEDVAEAILSLYKE